jgi:hypothetical protein
VLLGAELMPVHAGAELMPVIVRVDFQFHGFSGVRAWRGATINVACPVAKNKAKKRHRIAALALTAFWRTPAMPRIPDEELARLK